MERIQSAIAKARAERDANRDTLEALGGAAGLRLDGLRGAASSPAGADAAGPDVTGPDVTGPVFTGDPAITAAEAAVNARWQALPEFNADRGRLARNRIVAQAGGSEAASFDVLRTKILQQARANGWRRIAITSPTPGCGKSTIALNLGFSLARQQENRTLLLELDLRRPSLMKMLEIQDRRSLAAVLEGEALFEDCALRLGDGFALAGNARPARNPAELLHSDKVSRALKRIEADYAPDLVVFDMPPLLVSDDTMAFIGNVDAVLLIAAAEATSVKEIDHCERELASQTNVMGVVLNKCRHMGTEYGYGYGYY